MNTFNYIPIVIVCSGGFSFVTTNSLTSNTHTFMYANKYLITTLDTIRLQKEMMARNAMKNSQNIQ
jgi:hypothetical protein